MRSVGSAGCELCSTAGESYDWALPSHPCVGPRRAHRHALALRAVSVLPPPVLPDHSGPHWASAPAVPPLAATPRPPALVRALGVGATAIGLAALPYKLFELDRFFVPKEVVLQVAALVAVALTARLPPASRVHADDRRGPDLRGTSLIGAALLGFLVASAISAARAPSGWMAARALGVSAAGVALFLATRAAGRAGRGAEVLHAVAMLVGVAAGTALLQAYGVRTEYFSLNRAPGGTFGNRNFVAHLCAIGLPLLGYLALRARSLVGVLAATGTFAAAAAVLVLTRSRAAWLAAAVAAVPFTVGVLRARAARGVAPAARSILPGQPRGVGTRASTRVHVGRSVLLIAAAGVAAGAAVRLPNALDWRSGSPYLDSARGMVNYREGSGRGRLKQWTNSAHLLAAHPLLGVGPGNWPVTYPGVAPPGDPSLTDERTTANPWPSSDWVGMATERGMLGSGALAAAMLILLWRAHVLVWRSPTPDDRLLGGVLGAVLGATLTAGAFDAVLLLAAPTFLAWSAVGGLVGASECAQRARAGTTLPGPVFGPSKLAAAALGAVLAVSAALGMAHGIAMALYSTGRTQALGQAAVLAPGDYRVQLRAAQVALQTGRCSAARRWGKAARTLAPSAPGPARVLRACGLAEPRQPRATARP